MTRRCCQSVSAQVADRWLGGATLLAAADSGLRLQCSLAADAPRVSSGEGDRLFWMPAPPLELRTKRVVPQRPEWAVQRVAEPTHASPVARAID